MTRFDGVDTIGQLRPIGFEKLMRDDETTIQIHHDGRELAEIDASRLTIRQPRMHEEGTNCRINFRVDAVVVMETVTGDREAGDDLTDGSEAGNSDRTDVEDTETGTQSEGDGGNDEGKPTFSMSEGPTR